MQYRTLGRSGASVSSLCLGHDDLRRRDRRGRSPTPSSTPSSRPAARSSTPPTSTPPAPPRRSSAAGWPPGPPTCATGWSWRPRAASRWRDEPNGARELAPPPAPGARRLAAPARRRARRPLPAARLGPAHPARGDAALPRRRRPRGQDRLPGAVELHRLAGAEGRRPRRAPAPGRPGDAAAGLQPARARHRARDRPGVRAQRPGPAARGARSAGGWLSGKYTRDQRPTGATRLGEDPARGIEAYDRVGGQDRTWDVLEAVQDVAEAHGAPMAQVALRLAAGPARRSPR